MKLNVFDLPPLTVDFSRGCARALTTAIEAAIDAALRSPCAKDQRGAAVYHHNYGHLSAAHNSPPAPFVCDGSECKAACGKLAVHAEERALHRYAELAGNGLGRHGMILVHIRVERGQPVPSGPPSCIACSRTILERQALQVWLWHEIGWRCYTALEFHTRSLQHEKHRLPVILETP